MSTDDKNISWRLLFGLCLPSSDEAVLIHFGPELAARFSIDWRVTAGGLGSLGVAATTGGTVDVVELIWACTKERR